MEAELTAVQGEVEKLYGQRCPQILHSASAIAPQPPFPVV